MQIKTTDGAIQIDGNEFIPKGTFKAWVDDKNKLNIVALIVQTQLIVPTLFSSIEIDEESYSDLELFKTKIGQSFFKSAAGGGGLTPEEKEKVDSLLTNGDGTKYLANDGTYKAVSGLTPEQTNKVNAIHLTGDGNKYLSEDGLYKVPIAPIEIGSVAPTDIAPSGDGIYRAKEAGTYTNLGGLIAKEGFVTWFEKTGAVWALYSEVEIGISSGIINVSLEYPLPSGNYYTLETAILAVTADNRSDMAIIKYRTSVNTIEVAQFCGNIAQWTNVSLWFSVPYIQSTYNIIDSYTSAGSGRYTVRWNAEAGNRYIISSDSAFTNYVGGYYNSSNVKIGEIGGQNGVLQPNGRYSNNVATFVAPTNTAYAVFTSATGLDANSKIQVEQGAFIADLKPYIKQQWQPISLITRSVFDKETKPFVKNISNLNESSVSKNLYNPYTRLLVSSFLKDGEIVHQYTSDYIEVIEGKNYYYSRPTTANTYYYKVYDSSKVLLRRVLTPNITIGVGEKYVILEQTNDTTDTLSTYKVYEKIYAPIQFEEGLSATAYEPRYILHDYVLKSSIPSKYQTPLLTDKVCYVIGDSITASGYFVTPLQRVSKFSKIINLGSSGCEWSDTIIGGVSTANNIKERVDALVSSVTSNGNPDLIIIALGTNDWGNIKPIGDWYLTYNKTFSDVSSRETIYDSIKYGVMRIRTLYPSATIILTTPLQRVRASYTATDLEYINAIRKGGEMMGVSVIDNYSNTITPHGEWLASYYQDGLHITALGGEVVGKYMANELVNMFYNNRYA